MTDITSYSVYVTLLSLAILILVNSFSRNNNMKLLINILFLSESFVLTFFFDKYNAFLGFTIISLSFYYFVKSPKDYSYFQGEDITTKSSFPDFAVANFQNAGILGIFCVIIYEYHANNGDFSGNDFLIIALSVLFIFYKKIPDVYFMERDMSLMFLFLLAFLLIIPSISYKIIYGYVGEDSGDNWIDKEIFVFNLLGNPLANLLSALGYNVFASGSSIIFENMETGLMQDVSVAKACSGITSVIVFASLFFSYLWVMNTKFDSTTLLLFLLGLLTAYIANLLRMAIIVLAGHYWGMDALSFVHEYLGWFLFTLWMFLFWTLLNNQFQMVEGVQK